MNDGGTDVQVIPDGGRVVVHWRRPRSIGHWIGMFFGLVIIAFGAFFIILPDATDPTGAVFLPVGLGIMACGVVAIYAAIVARVDRRYLTFEGERVTLRRRPLWWGFGRSFKRADIVRFGADWALVGSETPQTRVWQLEVHRAGRQPETLEQWGPEAPARAVAAAIERARPR